MRFQALACDYDGTLATHSFVDDRTIAALKALRQSGRKLLMVTGRRLEDLSTVFSHAALFDRIVAENGALLYRPATNEEVVLAEPPPAAFVEALAQRGVEPVDIGRVIVATWEPHETVVLEVIRDLGLGMQIILNKGAVMVLPADVSKATGLRHALAELGLSPHNAAAVGDAENDHALLAAAECGVAVANSVDALKARADVVTAGDHGAGVEELIDQLLEDDLVSWAPRLTRHAVSLGTGDEGQPFRTPAVGGRYRVLAHTRDGLLAWVRAFVAQLSAVGRQWALVADCGTQLPQEQNAFPTNAVRAKTLEEVEQTLADPQRSAIVQCTALPEPSRPGFAGALLAHFNQLWGSVGRPHWVIWLDAAKMLDLADSPASDPLGAYGVVYGHAAEVGLPLWGANFKAVTFAERGTDAASLPAGAPSIIEYEPSADGLRFYGALPAWQAPAHAEASP